VQLIELIKGAIEARVPSTSLAHSCHATQRSKVASEVIIIVHRNVDATFS